MLLDSRPIQSTREGSHEPFHPGTIILSSSTRELDAAGSSGFAKSSSGGSVLDKLGGLSLGRSMRKDWPRKVIGIRSWTRKMFSTRSSLE